MALTPDESGFAEFVAARGTALQRTAYLLVGDHHTAQDLVQTALLQAAKHWARIHTSPEAYVRRSIFTANVSRWRRSKVSEVLAGDAMPESPGHRAEGPDLDVRTTVMSALATLTSKQRAVLVLRYYEDLTETQTADALGISTSTVKSTHRQALARLRERAPELATVLGRTL